MSSGNTGLVSGTDPGKLGEFLQARRAQLRPEHVGISTTGEQRRVPGLRREELARLAGVSPSYYTRLEQGQSRGASAAVLDAIAVALRLGPDEHEHLRRLAADRPHGPVRAIPERVHPAAGELLRSMGGVPALVQGRATDILAWNPLGHALLAGHLDFDSADDPSTRPNTARLIFLDAHSRSLYQDWPRKARAIVGNLRLAAGRYPEDPQLAAVLGDLTMHSAEFARMWADHRIRPCDAADYTLRHPLVGELTLTQQSLIVVAAPDQSLIAMIPAAGANEHALTLLQHSVGT